MVELRYACRTEGGFVDLEGTSHQVLGFGVPVRCLEQLRQVVEIDGDVARVWLKDMPVIKYVMVKVNDDWKIDDIEADPNAYR